MFYFFGEHYIVNCVLLFPLLNMRKKKVNPVSGYLLEVLNSFSGICISINEFQILKLDYTNRKHILCEIINLQKL